MKRAVNHPGMLLGAIVLCLLLSSLCILIVPAAHNRYALTMMCSGVFWAGMLAGYGILIYVNVIRRKHAESTGRRRTGIITFFRNAPARLIDIAWIISIILLVISVFAEQMQGFVQFVISFLIVFLFHMHCIFNGENFRFLQIMIRRDGK